MTIYRFKMKNTILISFLAGIIGFLFAVMFLKSCNGKEKDVKTKTEIKIEDVKEILEEKETKQTDTFYIETIKTVKGKDSIVYVDKPTKTSIQVKEFNTKLTSNNASVDLDILSTGEILKVDGFIEYPKETITVKETIKQSKSGLFMYGKVGLGEFKNPEFGVIYQFKNTIGVIVSTEYNQQFKQLVTKAGLLIKL